MDESGSTIDSVFTMREVVCKPITLIKLPDIKWWYDERITAASPKLRTRMHARTNSYYQHILSCTCGCLIDDSQRRWGAK